MLPLEILKLMSSGIARNVHLFLYIFVSAKFSRGATKLHEKGALFGTLKSGEHVLAVSPGSYVNVYNFQKFTSKAENQSMYQN